MCIVESPKLKVALINNCPMNVGMGRYAFMLSKSLRGCGMDVDHYFINKNDWCLYLNPAESSTPFHRAGRNLIADNPLFMKYGLSRLLLDYRLGRFIPRDYDLYHITHEGISNLVFYPNIGSSIITMHDVNFRTHPPHWYSGVLGRLTSIGIKKDSIIITDSDFSKSELMRYCHIPEEEIRVIYLAADTCYKPLTSENVKDIYSRYGLDDNARHILHIGGEPIKNITTLIKSFRMLVTDFGLDNVELIQLNPIKDAKERDELLKLSRRNQVRLIDYVPEEDLAKLYNIADIFIFPSLTEGFGLPALEAMSCGTPVIASNAGSIPEVVGDAGVVLEPTDVIGFARAMYDLLADDNLRQQMAGRGLERASLFSWEKTAQNTIEVYEKVIERRK